jgi:parvulin-like peptidyl-prolyl isomerase
VADNLGYAQGCRRCSRRRTSHTPVSQSKPPGPDARALPAARRDQQDHHHAAQPQDASPKPGERHQPVRLQHLAHLDRRPGQRHASRTSNGARKIGEIPTRLENGEDFARLAIATSHAQTALDGGSLGWRKGSQLPTLFADTVVRMRPGEYSKPLQSGSGFQIVKLNDMRGSGRTVVDQVHVRHILLRPNEILDEAAVRRKLLGIRTQLQRGDDFATIAKSVSEDKVSAADGGDMGWVDPKDFIPEFEQRLGTMPLNEVSEPLRTRYGWHLVEVLGRRTQDTTDEVKREQCSREVRANKAEEERELWIRRLRDQAFVCNYVTGGVQDCASAGVIVGVSSSSNGKVSSKTAERKKKNKTL